MKMRYRNFLIIIIIALFSNSALFAQGDKKKTTKIRVEYFNKNNTTEYLLLTLRIKEDRYIPFENATVWIYSVGDTSNVLLDKVVSNYKGEAKFYISDDPLIFRDSTGQMTFKAEYVGDDQIKSDKESITIKKATMEVSFFQKDTVKYIEVNVNELAFDNQKTPLSDMEIKLSVKGTFSNLNFANENTDENGKVVFEFPISMPGDTIGNLTIVSKIEDDDIYGNIESEGEINWGMIVPLAPEKQRGLGDTDAPLWMVYTLIILLSAVWFHYIYVIFLFFKIKMARKVI